MCSIVSTYERQKKGCVKNSNQFYIRTDALPANENSIQNNFSYRSIAVIYYCTINWIFFRIEFECYMCGHWWNHWNWNIVVLNVVQSTNSIFALFNCFHLNSLTFFFFNKIPSEIRNRFMDEKKRFQWQSKRRNVLWNNAVHSTKF